MAILLAVLAILVGIAVFASAKSTVHEILALLGIGFGIMTIGLAAIMHQLKQLNRSLMGSTGGPY